AELLRVLHDHHVVISCPPGRLATFSSDHEEYDVLTAGEFAIRMNRIVVHALVPTHFIKRVEVVELLGEIGEGLARKKCVSTGLKTVQGRVDQPSWRSPIQPFPGCNCRQLK
ncbi:hypothetical protein PMAYCL1PPCAC_20199, partial [Pristionchus mayeri]